MKIFKYPLYYYSVPELVRLPIGAKIIGAGIQEHNNPKMVFWALVNEGAEIKERIVMFAFTGKEIDGDVVDIFNTIQLQEGKVILNFIELENVKGKVFDPQKDDRLNNKTIT